MSENEWNSPAEVEEALAAIAASVQALLETIGLDGFVEGMGFVMNGEAMANLAVAGMAAGMVGEVESFLANQ